MRRGDGLSEEDAEGGLLSKQYWQARYESGQTGWDRGQPSPALTHWMNSGSLQPCRILVPGCGRGHEVVALCEVGFEVTAVDFAEAAVQTLAQTLLRKRLLAAVVASDIFEFGGSLTFDAVYEQTCLCAIDPARWCDYEVRLSQWLRPGGRLYASFMQTENPKGPPFGCDLDHMRNLFGGPRWRWCDEVHRVDHPLGLHEYACILVREEN